MLLQVFLLLLQDAEFVLGGFQPHGQLLHERKQVRHGCGGF